FATSTDRTRPKYYVLDMSPYPSGDGLHVGHPKGYTLTDVVARAKRMSLSSPGRFGLAARLHDTKNGMPSDVLERKVHEVGGGIDTDRVRVRDAQLATGHELLLALLEHRYGAGFRRDVEQAQAGIEGKHVGIVPHRMRFEDTMGVEIEDPERVV